MSSTVQQNTESEILARVITPEAPTLSPALAAELLKWGFVDFDRKRMSELASKARPGTLTLDEQAEIEGYERINSFLGLVKSKARRSLR